MPTMMIIVVMVMNEHLAPCDHMMCSHFEAEKNGQHFAGDIFKFRKT